MPSPTRRTTVRLAETLLARLHADPAAQANVSAFVRVVLDSFLAQGAPIVSTRALSLRLGAKVATQPTSLAFPRHVLAHYRRHARAAGGHPLSALIANALVRHYFGSAGLPEAGTSSVPVSAMVSAAHGHRLVSTYGLAAPAPGSQWRALLESLLIDETRRLTAADLGMTLPRARQNIFFAANALRHRDPGYRVTTRLAAGILHVTRIA